MFCLIIHLPCFDPYVLFCCLVFCSVSSSTERGLAQPLSSCSNRAPLYFCVLVRLRACGFKTFLARRRTKTQKYKGAQFEQLECGWAYHTQLKMKQSRKQDKKTRHMDLNSLACMNKGA